jgi:hypothetical protein
LPVCVCTSVSDCLSVYQYLSVCVSVCLSACLSVSVSVCFSACLSISVSVYLSVCLSQCLSVSVSVCLSVYLSQCLSVSVSVTPNLSASNHHLHVHTYLTINCTYIVFRECPPYSGIGHLVTLFEKVTPPKEPFELPADRKKRVSRVFSGVLCVVLCCVCCCVCYWSERQFRVMCSALLAVLDSNHPLFFTVLYCTVLYCVQLHPSLPFSPHSHFLSLPPSLSLYLPLYPPLSPAFPHTHIHIQVREHMQRLHEEKNELLVADWDPHSAPQATE